jgi:Flp pilus assembly protein TadB
VKDYEIIVKDYDKIIKSKNKLENDLLEEIRILKQEKNQTNSVITSIEESQEKLEIERKLITKKDNRKNKDSIQIFFWIFLVIVVFLIAMIPDGVWLILFLIGLPIYFFISAFKKLK